MLSHKNLINLFFELSKDCHTLIVEDEEWWKKRLEQFGTFEKLEPKSKRELAVVLYK